MIVIGATRFRESLLDINIDIHDYILRTNCKHLMAPEQRVTRSRIWSARMWITGRLTHSSFVSKLMAQIVVLYY